MMKLQLVLAAFVLAGVGTTSMAADDKADIKKLIVGKWEAVKADEGTLPVGSVVEFSADGKLKVTAKKGDVKETVEGSYTIDGSSFTYKLKFGDQEDSQKITIKKISETEMETTNRNNKNVTLKKSK